MSQLCGFYARQASHWVLLASICAGLNDTAKCEDPESTIQLFVEVYPAEVEVELGTIAANEATERWVHIENRTGEPCGGPFLGQCDFTKDKQWTGASGPEVGSAAFLFDPLPDIYELDGSTDLVICSTEADCMAGLFDENGNAVTCVPDETLRFGADFFVSGSVNYDLPCFP